jgi:hypothetical protein
MHKILIIIVFIVASCQQKESEPQTYYIITYRTSLNTYGTGYQDEKNIDSVEIENDSLAFWKGVTTYTANLMAQNMIKKQGGNPPYTTHSFDVLDKNGNSILHRISEIEMQKAQLYIKEHNQ